MKVARVAAVVVAVVGVGALGAWLVRTDPIGPIAGRALTGPEAPYPDDWRFSDAAYTIAVETNPADPHSVTTFAFLHEGKLHIPAMNGSGKRWTQDALANPNVRIKVGDTVYPARLVRIEPTDLEPYVDSAARKYAQMASALESGELPDDIWLFRVEPRTSAR